MSACEECWADAYIIARKSGRHQAEVYRELLKIFTHAEDLTQDMEADEK